LLIIGVIGLLVGVYFDYDTRTYTSVAVLEFTFIHQPIPKIQNMPREELCQRVNGYWRELLPKALDDSFVSTVISRQGLYPHLSQPKAVQEFRQSIVVPPRETLLNAPHPAAVGRLLAVPLREMTDAPLPCLIFEIGFSYTDRWTARRVTEELASRLAYHPAFQFADAIDLTCPLSHCQGGSQFVPFFGLGSLPNEPPPRLLFALAGLASGLLAGFAWIKIAEHRTRARTAVRLIT
jgi:hypothetical protein